MAFSFQIFCNRKNACFSCLIWMDTQVNVNFFSRMSDLSAISQSRGPHRDEGGGEAAVGGQLSGGD